MNYLQKKDRLLAKETGCRYLISDADPVGGRIRLYNEEKNQDEYFLLDDVRSSVANGEWTHEPERPEKLALPRRSPQAQNDPALDQRTEHALHTVREVKRLAKSSGISLRTAIQRLRTAHENGKGSGAFPSDATLYRLLRNDRYGLPLYFGDKNKGNRNPKRDPKIRTLITKLATELFAKEGSRWTLRDLVQNVNDIAHDRCDIHPKDRISRDYVRNVLYEVLGHDLEVDRMDPRTANSFKAIAQACIVATFPLERVEQDALHLPWRVVTEDGVSHRVYLLHAIDCNTGMPVGWTLTVGAPRFTDTLRCIEQCLYSKAKYFETLGISTGKDCFGTMQLIVFDNGPENKDKRIVKLSHVGIDVMHCKAHTPQEKPYIERFNRAVKEALQTLPGCTRTDDVDGDRDPETLGDLPMTLLELERWIVRFYFEDWANRPLKRLLMTTFTDPEAHGRTPWARWRHATEVRGQPVALPPSRQAWQKILYHYESRTLSRKTGITYLNFSFKGPNLPNLIKMYGEKEVTVLIDPDDFRRVSVLGPDEELIELVNKDVDEFTPAHTFGQAAQKLKDAEEDNTLGEMEQRAFRLAVFNASTVGAPKVDKPKGKTNKPAESKETSLQAKKAAAVQRAKQSPLTHTATSVSTSHGAGDLDFDDVQTLPVIDRRSGDAG